MQPGGPEHPALSPVETSTAMGGMAILLSIVGLDALRSFMLGSRIVLTETELRKQDHQSIMRRRE